MPTLTQLRYILAVHEHGHFGEAAKACHVTQPTLSTQILKAEATLGQTLFIRQRGPIVATPRGVKLIEQAQVVVAAHQKMLRMAEGLQVELSGQLVLGIIPTLAPYVTPWFLERFARSYPGVELTILERPTAGIITGVLDMHIDVGLLATPLGVPRLAERPLFYDPFYLYAAADDAILNEDEIDHQTLDVERLWLLEDGHCVRNQALAYCQLGSGKTFLSSVRFEAGSLETLRHLIDASGGYTLVPETFARLLPRESRLKQVRPFKEPTPAREVSLVHLDNTWMPDLIEALYQTLLAQVPRPFRREAEALDLLPVGVTQPHGR